MSEESVEQAEAPPKKDSFWKSLLFLALFAWVLRSLIVAPFSIPSGSMLPNMYIGDYLFVQKWPYGYSRYSFPFGFPSFDGRVFQSIPKRGDIVIFRKPGAENEDWVKRVIGVPGDTVQVVGGSVVLNGKQLARTDNGMIEIPVSPNTPCRVVPGATQMVKPGADGPICLYPTYRESLPNGPTYLTIDQVQGGPADDFGPVTVPAGSVFLMGDNRDDSLDSRFSPYQGGIGIVPMDHLVGRATVRFWSTDGSASWINPISWFTALRGDRVAKSYNR